MEPLSMFLPRFRDDACAKAQYWASSWGMNLPLPYPDPSEADELYDVKLGSTYSRFQVEQFCFYWFDFFYFSSFIGVAACY
jgi:hypothetical protein